MTNSEDIPPEITPAAIARIPECLDGILRSNVRRGKNTIFISCIELTLHLIETVWSIPTWEWCEGKFTEESLKIPPKWKTFFDSLRKHNLAFLRDLLAKGKFRSKYSDLDLTLPWKFRVEEAHTTNGNLVLAFLRIS